MAKLLEDDDLFEFDDERVLVKLECLFNDNDMVEVQDLRDVGDFRD